MRAVADAGELLLGDGRWDARVGEVLGLLGRATKVDRVDLFEVEGDRADGPHELSHRLEWAGPGVKSQTGSAALQHLPLTATGFGRWEASLGRGEPIAGDVAGFPETERPLLASLGVVSCAVMPIHVLGRWWGFVALGSSQLGRSWPDADRDALRAVARLLGAAVRHDALLRDLRSSRSSNVDALRREREASDRVRELDGLRSAFIEAVSHELRTPLHTILGLGETLSEHRDRLTEEQQVDMLTRLRDNGRRLDGMLANLLDLNRLRSGELVLDPSPTQLRPFIRTVIAGCDALGGLQVELEVPAKLVVWIDTMIVERMLMHLLENVAVHGGQATTVWVTCALSGDYLRMAVEDDGRGVLPKNRERIFEPFAHGKMRRPHAPGAGMGLAIVRRFADLHGGSVLCGERPGGGAAFHLTLLVAAPPDPTDEMDVRDELRGSA